uniref:Uncharacterized protein n=1 Tax=Anolis carolinensis TaxID=28377 RepID=A0A803TAB1_ANOCA
NLIICILEAVHLLIEISSCFVKHTEVTQNIFQSSQSLKKSRLYATRQNIFLHFLLQRSIRYIPCNQWNFNLEMQR